MSDTEAAARQDYADYAGEIGNISPPVFATFSLRSTNGRRFDGQAVVRGAPPEIASDRGRLLGLQPPLCYA